jgi:hypothetical protein
MRKNVRSVVLKIKRREEKKSSYMGRGLRVDMCAGVECNARRFSDDGLANVGVKGAPPSKPAPASKLVHPKLSSLAATSR